MVDFLRRPYPDFGEKFDLEKELRNPSVHVEDDTPQEKGFIPDTKRMNINVENVMSDVDIKKKLLRKYFNTTKIEINGKLLDIETASSRIVGEAFKKKFNEMNSQQPVRR